MEQMTAQEGCEIIQEMLDRWDYCMKVVMAEGYTEAQAADIVGRYFNKQIGLDTPAS